MKQQPNKEKPAPVSELTLATLAMERSREKIEQQKQRIAELLACLDNERLFRIQAEEKIDQIRVLVLSLK